MTGTTKVRVTATVSLVMAALATAPLQAQSDAGAAQPAQRAGEGAAPAGGEVCFIGHDKIVGASVLNALEGLDGDAQQTLGSIAELVIDGATGSVRCAVLASGGELDVGAEHRAVAWRLLRWDAGLSRFTAALSPEMLEKMPEFAPKDPRRFDCGDAPAVLERSANVEDRGSFRGQPGEQPAPPAAYMLASEIVGCQVSTRGHGLGVCETLFIEPVSGSTAFLSVASGGFVGIGGIDYVVPWKALTIERGNGEQQQPVIRLDVSPNAFASAPRLSDEGADLDEPAFRQRVYDFYGVRSEFEFERIGAAPHAAGWGERDSSPDR